VEAYIAAWCDFLGLGELQVSCDFEDPTSGVQFVCGRLRGQMFPYFREVAPHLCEFAGLYDILHELQDEYVIDCDETSALDCGVREGGVRLCLGDADRASTQVVSFLREKAGTLEDVPDQNALVKAARNLGYKFSLKDWLCTLRVLIAAYRCRVEPRVLADLPSQLEKDPLAGCPNELLVGWEWKCDHIGLSATAGKFRVLLSWEKVLPLLDDLPLERGQ